MNKLLLFVFIFSISLSAQDTVIKDFDSIVNMEDAENFLKANDSKFNKIVVFNEEKHQTTLALDLFNSGSATLLSDTEKVKYKVIEKSSIKNYRVSYIFFDGLKMPVSEINALRDEIMALYKEGTPFSLLASRYSMDENANRGGDLGWFEVELTHPTFESEITNSIYSVGDVFTIDIVQNQWYYIVLKTHEPKEIKEIKVLKIVEPLIKK
jgi:parvulin-like peptidyl-prolyl isomerase